VVEVDLRIDGKSAFEYQSSPSPRVGEYLDIQHEYAKGIFKVTNVTHKIVEFKNSEIMHYLLVEAETVR
jgi:hypothetical protein